MKDSTKAAPLSALFGVFLISLATLLLEVAWMRVLSVTLWYHFAFLALSTALFGFGLSGVVISLTLTKETPSKGFADAVAFLTPVAFVAGFAVSNAISFEPFSLGRDPKQWIYLPLFYLTVSMPFFFSGLTIASQTARLARHVHQLYLFDLVGAGMGAVVVVFLLPLLEGSGTLIFAAAIAAFGAALLLQERGIRVSLALGVLGGALCIAAFFGERLIPVRISTDKVTGDNVPLGELFKDPSHHLYSAWNSASRVDVLEWRDAMQRPQRAVFIDGGVALTRLPHLTQPIDKLRPGNDEESFFYQLYDKPDALVIGSGGGREILLALRNRAQKVAAVELNPDINDIASRRMADFTGHLFDDPRVHLFTDEARSFLNRSRERFDIIHCPHTISNAAMASGSLSLSENYLLTVEAFRAYLSHLSPTGVLVITRPEAHLPRLFSTVRASIDSTDATFLSSRIAAWRAEGSKLSFYAGMAFKKTPFSQDEISRFKKILEQRNLDPVYLPDEPLREPYQSLVQGKPLSEVPLSFAAILEPAVDDAPFFNRRIPFSSIRLNDIIGVFSSGTRGRDALEDRPVTEAALIVLLLETVALAFFIILLPLMLFQKKSQPKKGRLAYAASFFFLGLAYILVEIGLIQRLTLYLGRPVIVYSTVLCTILCASGIGSMVSGKRLQKFSAHHLAAAAGISVLVAAFIIGSAVRWTLDAALPIRIAVAVVLLAVPGFFMGMPFPTLIRRLNETARQQIPLGFGINGFASTVGTVVAMLIAMTLGQTALLVFGVLCYGAVVVAARRV